jgi:hypothetical protein
LYEAVCAASKLNGKVIADWGQHCGSSKDAVRFDNSTRPDVFQARLFFTFDVLQVALYLHIDGSNMMSV